MHLQGNLQAVFDALYDMGVIEPVLKMNWTEVLESEPNARLLVAHALDIANKCQSDIPRLVNELTLLDESTLQYLAMEVAREYADFHARTSLQ